MRALSPVREGRVQRGGVRSFFEVYGDGDPTIVLLTSDTIVQSRAWKAQIPFSGADFARGGDRSAGLVNLLLRDLVDRLPR